VTRLRTDDVASESGWPSAAFIAHLLPLPAMMFLAIRRYFALCRAEAWAG
jgi:hypothetical protein